MLRSLACSAKNIARTSAKMQHPITTIRCLLDDTGLGIRVRNTDFSAMMDSSSSE